MRLFRISACIVAAALGFSVLAAATGEWQNESPGPAPVRLPLRKAIGNFQPTDVDKLPAQETEWATAGPVLELSTPHDAWPRLRKKLLPYAHFNGAPGGMDSGGGSIELGSLYPGNQPSCAMSVTNVNWTACELRYAYGTRRFSVWVSRATPGLMVEAQDSNVTLLDGGAVQWTHLLGGGNGLESVTIHDVERLPADLFVKNWMLIWGRAMAAVNTPYRSRSQGSRAALDRADFAIPMLVVFSSAPSQIAAASKGGVTLHFSDKSVRLVLCPLFGDRLEPWTEVEKWHPAIPETVARRCGQLAVALGQYPTNVVESYGFDAKQDAPVVTDRLAFAPVLPESKPFSFLPPMLALGREFGLPVRVFPDRLSDVSLDTGIGPFTAVEGSAYSWSLPGMGRYALEERAPAGGGAIPDWLRRKLEAEIDKILKAGHLAPLYIHNYLPFSENEIFWDSPGDSLYFLGKTIPLLDPDRRQRIAAYLQQERQDFPPEDIVALSHKYGSQRPFHLPMSHPPAEIAGNNFHLLHQQPHVESLAGLWEFYRLGLDRKEMSDDLPDIREAIFMPWVRRSDWATLGWDPLHLWKRLCGFSDAPWDTIYGAGGIADANRWIGASIAMVRMARMAGDPETENLAWGMLARGMALRYASGQKYAEYLYNRRFFVPPSDPQ